MLKYNKWLYSSILEATICSRDVPFKIDVTITWKHEWAISTFMTQYNCARSHRPFCLTYWGRVTHICVSNLTIIGSDNGLSPGRRQAIIWTNAGILLIRNLVTNLSEILSKIHTFSIQENAFENVCEMTANLPCPQCVKMASETCTVPAPEPIHPT